MDIDDFDIPEEREPFCVGVHDTRVDPYDAILLEALRQTIEERLFQRFGFWEFRRFPDKDIEESVREFTCLFCSALEPDDMLVDIHNEMVDVVIIKSSNPKKETKEKTKVTEDMLEKFSVKTEETDD